MLSVSKRDLDNAVQKARGEQLMLNLKLEEGAKRLALLKEIQSDPATRKFLHADFYEISMDREITVTVGVRIVGKSPGVEEGGLLNIVRRELDVTALPGKMPEAIEVDISALNVGDAIHLGDLTTEEGVEIVGEPEYTVVTVVSPISIEEGLEEEEVEGEEGEEAEGEEGGEGEESSE